MTLILSTDGAIQLLNIVFNNQRAVGGNNLTVRLFTNNITPAITDHFATYEEASGGGYVSKVLTMGNWLVGTNPDNTAKATYMTEQIWTFTGAISCAKTIYGYYITDADSQLLWAEKIPTPFIPGTTGLTLKATPVIQMGG